TPVVAVAQGGYRETVIDGVNGYLAERSAASLGEGIIRIMRGELKTTPSALHALVSRDWSWDVAAARIAAQLRLAASKPKSREQWPLMTGTVSASGMPQYDEKTP
ncbi:MAG: glycosyltransferase, partial [Mycobacterium sp.]